MNPNKPSQDLPPIPHNIWPGAHLVLIILAFIVLVLMFLAWAMPAATPRVAEGTGTATLTDMEVTGTPQREIATPESNGALTSEEVGYADGIIILSAGLMLIVLFATLREVIWYRKKVDAKKSQNEED